MTFFLVWCLDLVPPVTVALNNIVNSTQGVKEYNVDMAAAMIAALPTMLVYIIAGKYFEG